MSSVEPERVLLHYTTGITHRDVRPRNILIRKHSNHVQSILITFKGLVKETDFGLAKLVRVRL